MSCIMIWYAAVLWSAIHQLTDPWLGLQENCDHGVYYDSGRAPLLSADYKQSQHSGA